jgi:hypothetical protein
MGYYIETPSPAIRAVPAPGTLADRLRVVGSNPGREVPLMGPRSQPRHAGCRRAQQVGPAHIALDHLGGLVSAGGHDGEFVHPASCATPLTGTTCPRSSHGRRRTRPIFQQADSGRGRRPRPPRPCRTTTRRRRPRQLLGPASDPPHWLLSTAHPSRGQFLATSRHRLLALSLRSDPRSDS